MIVYHHFPQQLDRDPIRNIENLLPVDLCLLIDRGHQQQRYQRFNQGRYILNRDGTTPTQGPVITRWTLRSYPAPKRPRTWQLPILLAEDISNRTGQGVGVDPLSELVYLETLATTGLISPRSI